MIGSRPRILARLLLASLVALAVPAELPAEDLYIRASVVHIGDGTSIEAVRAELERLARLQQERVLMDRLAREIDADLDPRVLDPSLRDAWRRTRP